jgi:hypothetical protein
MSQGLGRAPISRPAAGPAAAVAHHTRGRVRLKIPAAQTNPALLDQIKTAFSGLPGIDHIETRPASASIVLYYDPDHHADVPELFRGLAGASDHPDTADMLHAASSKHRAPSNRAEELASQIEQEAEFLAEHSTFARAIVDLAKQLDRELKRSTNNNLDLKILVPIGLAAFTFLEIGAAAATPMWVTLMIFSLNHFVELHAHDNDEDDDDRP